MIEDARGCVDYEACGDGPTVVLVPGSCSTGAAWRPMIARWGSGLRCVTTSLLGYGGTAERRTPSDADISHEAEILEAVIRRAAGPVHLVGHSFGGLAALAVALRNRVTLLSLTIIEAPGVGVLHALGEHAHYRTFRAMTDDYFAAFDAGESAAIEAMIDFYGGAGTFASWPPRVRSYAIETTSTNILDWASAYGFQPSAAALATIAVPTLVLWGEASHKAVQRANALLGRHLARAAVAPIPGAAHFMIATHATEVAAVVGQHIARAESVRQPAA